MLQRYSSRLIFRNCYSTQIAKKQNVQDIEVSKTKLSNGLTVITADVKSKHSNISIFIRAGSRFEDPSVNLGVSHCLRSASCFTSSTATSLKVTNLLSQYGGSFSVTGDREHIIYKLKSGKKVWRDLFCEVLAPSLCNNHFFWWELQNINKAMKSQLAQAQEDPTFSVMDAMHLASFRGGLGNSIFCPEHLIGSHTEIMVKNFFRSRYIPDNVVLVGTGVDHVELCDVGNTMQLGRQPAVQLSASPSSFISSETRFCVPGDQVSMCLSFPGASVSDQDAIVIALLQRVMGSNDVIKRQSGKASGLPNLVSERVSDPFTLSSYNINYSDCGSIGVYLGTASRYAASLLTAVADEISEMAKGDISEAAILAAKEGVKAEILMASENADGIIDNIGKQVSAVDDFASAGEIADKVDAITSSQVNGVVKRVLGGPKSLAVVGNICAVPYLSDL